MRRRLLLLVPLFLVVTGLLTFGRLHVQSSEEHFLQNNFSERSLIVAGEINGLLSTEVSNTPQLVAEYGGVINRRAFDQLFSSGATKYAAVVNEKEGVLISRGVLDWGLIHQAVKSSTSFLVENVKNGVLPIAIKFQTRTGERILIQGESLSGLSSFLTSTLAAVPHAASDHLLIIDKGFTVLGEVGATIKTGGSIPESGRKLLANAPSGISPSSGRFFSTAPILNGQWKIVISTTQDNLYAPIEGLALWLPWIVITVAMSAFGLILVLLQRGEVRKEELSEAAATLKKRNAEITKTNADLASFASVAAHDIRGPLRKSASFIGLIEEDDKSSLSPKAKDYFERAKKNLSTLDQLTVDLVHYARAGEKIEHFAKVSIRKVVSDVLELLSEDIKTSKAQIELRALPPVSGNEGTLKHVMQNLISNALKFVVPGERPHIEIWGEKGSYSTNIYVRDHGIGIPEEYRGKVFEPFQRLHPSSEYEGTGIGLALCKRIIEKHGGLILIHSPESGLGTIVEIRMPNGTRH